MRTSLCVHKTAVMHDAHKKHLSSPSFQRQITQTKPSGLSCIKCYVIWGLLTKKKCTTVNRQRESKQKVTAPKENKRRRIKTKRRYQTLDTQAPVSNIQTKRSPKSAVYIGVPSQHYLFLLNKAGSSIICFRIIFFKQLPNVNWLYERILQRGFKQF